MTEEEVSELIAEQMRMGLAVEFHDWREPSLGVRRIVWVPGEPNGIAATIIRHVVNGEVILELDGREYVIKRKF